MNNGAVIGLVALVVGFGGGYVATKSSQPAPMVHEMGNAMEDMTAGLAGKSGDEFDKSFLSEMILHHEGAVEMAEAALQSAKHKEIKDMANAIITAQTAEITQMKEWQKSWYGIE